MTTRLKGLIAATHTPFNAQGEVNLDVIESLAHHLIKDGVKFVFINGTTGESSSLTTEERLALTRRWCEIAKGTPIQVIVHVGSNCIADSRALAQQAQAQKAFAISAVAPSYFKPKSLEALIICCQSIASAAPDLPFHYYDIPPLTGVSFSMPEFLTRAPGLIPTLEGIKFSNPDLGMFQRCLSHSDGKYVISWGIDEYLLAALALGGSSAVGSSYNFAAPIHRRTLTAFQNGDLPAARKEQLRALQLIELLASFGYMAAAKATMGFLGVEVGGPRLPHTPLSPDQVRNLRSDLEKQGFFDSLTR